MQGRSLSYDYYLIPVVLYLILVNFSFTHTMVIQMPHIIVLTTISVFIPKAKQVY